MKKISHDDLVNKIQEQFDAQLVNILISWDVMLPS